MRMKTDDVEKARSNSLHSVSGLELESSSSNTISNATFEEKVKPRCRKWIVNLKGVETRGIEPIPLEERQPVTPSTSLHMLLMWFSMSLATNNIVVGSMGTFVLGLSFKDAALCAVFGNLLGASTIGYMSIWGPRSGNRTLVG